MTLSTYSHAYGESNYHLVMSTKYRNKAFLRDDIRLCCKNVMFALSKKLGIKLFEIEFGSDHVHMFIGLRPDQSLSNVYSYLKSRSTKELLRVYPELLGMFRKRHLWSRGKFYRSIGEVTSDRVVHYIRDSQKKHGPYPIIDPKNKPPLPQEAKQRSLLQFNP